MRVKRHQPEYDSQVAVVAWARLNQVKYPPLRLLYAIPNSGKLPIQYRIKLLKSGLLPGAPDLALPFPSGPFHALYVEMKAHKPKGYLSPEQKELHPILQEYGNKVVVCHSAESAINELISYLSLPSST